MMYQEFEELAGYEVSYEDYANIIEPMYMATELSKQDFIKCLDKKRFALKTEKQLISAMKKEAKHLREICNRSLDYDSLERLNDLVNEYQDRFHCICWVMDAYVYPDNRGCSYPSYINLYSTDGTYYRTIELVA